MNKYVEPEIEIVSLNKTDIIVTSGIELPDDQW